METQSFAPVQDQSNIVPEPINWENIEQLPPVTDTTQQSPILCTEGMDIFCSYETFTRNDKDE